jgi:hypothetical protein
MNCLLEDRTAILKLFIFRTHQLQELGATTHTYSKTIHIYLVTGKNNSCIPESIMQCISFLAIIIEQRGTNSKQSTQARFNI